MTYRMNDLGTMPILKRPSTPYLTCLCAVAEGKTATKAKANSDKLG